MSEFQDLEIHDICSSKTWDDKLACHLHDGVHPISLDESRLKHKTSQLKNRNKSPVFQASREGCCFLFYKVILTKDIFTPKPGGDAQFHFIPTRVL